MKPLCTHTGKAVPLRRSNVDTDQLYPAQRILGGSLTKHGHANALMAEWRSNPDFVLNRPEHAGATILVAGPEFATGSSREWAVWALADYSFRVILAPSFGDIFRGNATNNGLVAAALPIAAIETLWGRIEDEPDTPVTVDLERRAVSLRGEQFELEYPEDFRRLVMAGLDEVDLTLRHAGDIDAYEARRRASLPKVGS